MENLSSESVASLNNAIVDILINNAWIIVAICITVIAIVYMLIGLITWIFKLIEKRFENSEYIEIGKFKIKNKHYQVPAPIQNPNNLTSINTVNGMELNRFITLIDLVISNKIVNISKTVIENIVDVNKLENDYEHNSDIIFKTTFTTVINEYYESLIAYACKATGFSIENINKTREYFFISNMLKNLEKIWLEKSKTILNRNGFIQILEDNSKGEKYIEELNNCISQAIELRHIEVTAMTMNEIEEIITDLTKSTKLTFIDMFNKLGELKKNTLEKKEIIMNNTNGYISRCISEIMDDIIYKIMNVDSKLKNNCSTSDHTLDTGEK